MPEEKAISNEECEKFINLVREHPCIYYVTSTEYKDAQKVRNVWESVGQNKGRRDISVADWLKAVRAMEILGVLFIGGAGFCGFFKIFVAKNQDSFLKIAAATGIAAGVFLLTGAIVYGTKFAEIVPPGAYQHLFVGFGLVIVAGVFSVVSGILFVLAGSREQSSPGVIMNMNTTK